MATQQSTTGRSRIGLWIAVAIIVVIGTAAIIAVATRGNDQTGTSVPSNVEEVRPVQTSGDPLAEFTDSTNDPAIGRTAPTIDGASFDGTPITSAGDTPTLLIFLAHWCPHCRAEVPRLVQWNKDGQVPAGLRVIGVATSTSADRPNYPPSAWLEREQFPWPVIADSETYEAAAALGLTSFPYFVLLDENGNVALRLTGEIDPSQLTGLINQALA